MNTATAVRLLAPTGFPGDIWRCALTSLPEERRAAALCQAEKQRASRFAFERDRVRFVCAHVALREVLADWVGDTAPAALAFAQGPHGKPFLPAVPGCHFNLSHSDEAALIAVSSQTEVGVDIERVRPLRDAASLVSRYFTAEEQAAWHRLPPTEQPLGFYQVWARKEACVKALGCGLSFPLEAVDVGATTASQTLSLRWPSDRQSSQGADEVELSVCSLHLPEGWVGAVAWVAS